MFEPYKLVGSSGVYEIDSFNSVPTTILEYDSYTNYFKVEFLHIHTVNNWIPATSIEKYYTPWILQDAMDGLCECGAKKTKQPGHSYFCRLFKKNAYD